MKILSFDIGIKNLAYCYADTSGNNIKDIISWDVINLCETYKCNFCQEPAVLFKENCYYCKKHSNHEKYKLPIKKININNLSKKKLDELKKIADGYSLEYDKKIKKVDLLNKIELDISNNYLENIVTKKTTDYDLVDIGINIKKKLDKIFLNKNIDKILIENQLGPLAVRMKCIQCMVSQYFIDNNYNNIEFISAINKLKGFSKISLDYKDRKKDGILYSKEVLEKNNHIKYIEIIDKHKKKDDMADSLLQLYWFINKLYCGNT